MPGPYTPNPDDASTPTDAQAAGMGAAELRALKAKINTIVTNLAATTALATTAAANVMPTGLRVFLPTTAVQAGFAKLDGTSIGNVASNATQIADDAIPKALYEYLWPIAAITMQTFLGAGVAKGVSADADWAANKRLLLPNEAGLFVRSLDMTGTVDDPGRTLLSTQLDQNKSHSHQGNISGDAGSATGIPGYQGIGAGGAGVTTTISGGSEARPKNIAYGAYMKL